MEKISFKKYLSVYALGFGLGGLLWGLALYMELPDLEYPFHYLAIISMALFGGGTIGLFSDSFKDVIKAILAGLIGWTVGVVMAFVTFYHLVMYGVFILSMFLPSSTNVSLLHLEPNNIGVAEFWLVFLLMGMIIGFFYAIFLKTKIWPLVWRSGLGLALASLISPVIGNIIGNYFDSLLLSYLITFSLIGIIFGKFLGWGIYRFKK